MINFNHELLKIARELTALSGLRLEHNNRGYHDDQSDDSIIAYVGDRMAGYIDYSEYRGEVSIQMVSVKKEFRRQGVATSMLRELDKLYPDIEINPGMTTPEGTKLLAEYQRRYPKKLDFEGGVSNKDFVLSLVPDFGKHADKLEWYEIASAFEETGLDLRRYDMSYEPNIEQFRKDIAKVTDSGWAKAAKQLRSDLRLRKNSDL